VVVILEVVVFQKVLGLFYSPPRGAFGRACPSSKEGTFKRSAIYYGATLTFT
jgi:hypothetical protein